MFRDDLRALLPEDERARRLSEQTVTLAELLAREETYQPPALSGRALYHFHCQQRAVLSTEAEPTLLRRTGLHVDVPDVGCCGMAGAFGFQERTYPLSKALAERALLPAVRDAGHECLVVADGFSCREQLRTLGDVRALHTAQVLASIPQRGA